MSRIGFIGTGHIAAPMVRHLAAKGHDITVTRRSEAVSAALAQDPGVAVTDPQGVIDASDCVVLCLRPHVAVDVLEPLTFRADQQIISVMAGISTEQLGALCAPAIPLLQSVPF